MVQDKPIKFGVIGAGKIGTFHTRTLAKMKGVTLVGVCDPDVMRAQNSRGRTTAPHIPSRKNSSDK